MSTYIQPVTYRTVRVCAHCGESWDAHLPVAREWLRGMGYRFHVEADGVEYPTPKAMSVEASVSTVTCATLAKGVDR